MADGLARPGKEKGRWRRRGRSVREKLARARRMKIRLRRKRPPGRREDRRLRRGIYLLPSLFTVSNLFCGFYSVISTMSYLSAPEAERPVQLWNLEVAALLIGVAFLLDGLDGRIARLAGASSSFGFHLDSLADVISFGMAPALLFYVWGLQPLGRTGWLIAFIFVVCCAARLARYNVKAEAQAGDPKYFVGMSTPTAACQLGALVYFAPVPLVSKSPAAGAAAVSLAVSYLMVSHFKYLSFKKLGLNGRRSYIFVVFVGLVLVAIAAWPQVALLGLAIAYTLSGPAQKIYALLRGQRPVEKAKTAAPAGEGGEPAERRESPRERGEVLPSAREGGAVPVGAGERQEAGGRRRGLKG